ncbi:hypothetical protein KQI48_18085 [Cellulomonas hominis]|uniref:hypothetical protein n=1 Tax=Cellulomonas hominis TaxID=156981 RepID=UPI001C11FAE3|nr:hypothetical protein [Cellulomonas hominis]MBU5424584.1 hypothetical protein [Cellulomonas hominis]
MTEVLNSREWAILTLLVACALVVLATPSARKALLRSEVRRGTRVVVVAIIALAAWVTALVAGASRLGLWDSGLTKDTVVWFAVTALSTVFAPLDAAKTDRYFLVAARQAVAASVFLQYAMNLYAFSYLAEVALQLGLVVLACLLVVAERDPRHKAAHKPLLAINALIGMALILLTARELDADWNTLDARQMLLGLALSIWLPLGVLPFVWLLALYMSYEALTKFLRKPIFGNPAPLKTRVLTLAALGPDLRTTHDLTKDHNTIRILAETRTRHETFEAVRVFRRKRDRRRARPALAAQRLQRFAGAAGHDLNGRRLDQREMKETRDSLRWLATCHMNHHRNKGHYEADLLDILGDFARKGLPEDHGIQMTVAHDGQSWHAWRRTPSGLILGVAALNDPADHWYYAGTQPPNAPPPHDPGWERRASSSPDWR